MINSPLFLLLLVGAFVGAAAGYIGSFMVLKRMSLVGDALSHVALPGIAIALMLSAPPMLGAIIALTIAVVGVWYFQETSHIYPDALVGVFFTTSLAIGVLITPEADLLEALFGTLEKITTSEAYIAIFASFFLLLATYTLSHKLTLGIVSEELAKSTGISTKKINLAYNLLVGAIVALGVKFVGTLLMGALVIIPAVTAKNLSRGFTGYSILSMTFGVVSAVVGVYLALRLNFSPGPIVVLTGVFFFLSSYLFKSLRS